MKKGNRIPYIYIRYLKMIINGVEGGKYSLYSDGRNIILKLDGNGDFSIGDSGRKEIESLDARKFIAGHFYGNGTPRDAKFRSYGTKGRKGETIFSEWRKI